MSKLHMPNSFFAFQRISMHIVSNHPRHNNPLPQIECGSCLSITKSGLLQLSRTYEFDCKLRLPLKIEISATHFGCSCGRRKYIVIFNSANSIAINRQRLYYSNGVGGVTFSMIESIAVVSVGVVASSECCAAKCVASLIEPITAISIIMLRNNRFIVGEMSFSVIAGFLRHRKIYYSR